MDPKKLREIQEYGWEIAAVKENACFVRCPSRGCGMLARIEDGAKIPHRIKPEAIGEVRVTQYSDIRDELRARRKELRLTSAEVDDVSGLTSGHIAKAEQDNPYRHITLPVLISWANSLGYNIALLPADLPPVTLRMISDTRKIEEARTRHPRFRTAARARDRRA